MKRLLKILIILFTLWLFVFLSFYYLVQRPGVQTYLTQKAAELVSSQLNTKVNIRNVNIKFFRRIVLNDVYIEDKNQDTLLYVNHFHIKFGILQLFRKKFELKKVELNHVKLFVHRMDSMESFNYNFIIGEPSTDPKVKSPTQSKPLQIILGDISIGKFDFNYLDELKKKQFRIAFDQLDLSVDELNLAERRMALNNLELSKADILVRKMLEPQDTVPKERDTLGENTPFNPDHWYISAKSVIVNESLFQNINENKPRITTGMDYNHLYVDKIDINLEHTEIIGDTIFSKVLSLSAAEKCGFVINKLSADAKVSTTIVECKNLDLETGHSRITDYFSMNYDRFADFNDFVDSVSMTGDFENAKLSIRDIDYFAKGALKKVNHNTLKLTGVISGTVANLKGKNLQVALGLHSSFKGSVSFKDLPVFEETFMLLDFEEIQTSISDLKRIYPHINYPANLTNMGYVKFFGTFTGFKNDFVADGNLITKIGGLTSDINFKIDPVKNTSAYSGNFATQDFDLGMWLEQEQLLGKVNVSTNIKGSGLELSTMKASLDGIIQSIMLNDYDYQDIKIQGDLQEKYFKGLLSIRDPNLDFDFQGAINLKDSIPVFNFNSELRKASLKPLKISDENYEVTSSMALDFEGRNLDDFVGYAGLFNTQIKTDEDQFNIDTFELSTQILNEYDRTILLKSDIANGYLKGNVKTHEFPLILQELFNYYFMAPENVIAEFKERKDQNFEFDILVRNTKNLTQLITPDFKNLAGANIYGSYNSQANFFDFNSAITGITYKDFQFKDIHINSTTESDIVRLTASVDSLLRKDSLFLKHLVFDSHVKQDSTIFQIKTQTDSCANRLDLHGLLNTDFKSKSVTINMLPSTLYLNNEEWTISKNNRIFYAPGILDIKNLVLAKGESELEFKTFNDHLKNNHLSMFMRNIELAEITDPFYFFTKLRFDGLINGSLSVINTLKDPSFVASVKVDSFKINQEKLGDINISSNYEPVKDKINVFASLIGETNDIKISGDYALNKDKDNLNMSLDINKLNLIHLEPFVSQEVTKLQGMVDGKLHVKGATANPQITGTIQAKEVQARVNYLNTIYSFDNEEITFKPNEIDLGNLVLLDIEKNEARASGKIFYPNYDDLIFDLAIETDNFQFLNTTHATSEQFYGQVFAGGIVIITGPLNHIDFYVVATTNKQTNVSIDVAGSKDLEQYSFYRFVDVNSPKKTNTREYKTRVKPINLNFDLEVTPDAEMNLILNYEQGDVIQGRGEGNIKMKIDNYGDFTITGSYTIVDGNYLFSMQNIISKRFSMGKGSTITWTGNPTDARLNINAVYKLRAAPYDLIEDIVTDATQIQQAKNRLPVYLYLNITGDLLRPEIKFNIKVPDAGPAIKTALDSKFQLIQLDPNEYNRQVVGLLVLNRFLPVERGTGNTNIASDVNNSVSEFLSNQLSIYLSDWISEFVTEVQVDVNYRSYQNEIAGVDDDLDFQNRRELQLALTKTFLNDRISIDVGGNFDFGEENTTTPEGERDRASNIAGDFEIQYSITPDGRVKIKAFRRGEYDIFQERNRNKTGVGVSYQKQFDSIQDFFQKIRKRREERRTESEDDLRANP